jgi:hypothetical protein
MGQSTLDILASVWFEPGEIHIDDVHITYGFVRAYLEVSDTLDSRYEASLENQFGQISWRELNQLEKKSKFGVVGNISYSKIIPMGLSGDASRSRTVTQASEQEMNIPLYTLQSMRSHRWVMFGIKSANQILQGRVVDTPETPLVRLVAKYDADPGEIERPVAIAANVSAGIDDLKVIVTPEKSHARDPNNFELEAVTKALLARAISRGRRAYDDKGQPIPLLLAQDKCTSRLGIKA